MRIIDPHVEVPDIEGEALLRNIEKAGRTCYKSEAKITEDSYKSFVEMIMKSGHHSMFEHEKVTVRIICDRGVSHEIVRHRLAAYSQESTRYCNYSGDKLGKEITLVKPFFFSGENDKWDEWARACYRAETAYMELLKMGASPQEARSVLPNSLKTEIVVTYNLREWRHFFNLRAAKTAHPQMQQVAIPLLLYFKEKLSPLFDDIEYNQNFNPSNYAKVVKGQ
jgi:thymidylate synthase (FAD)